MNLMKNLSLKLISLVIAVILWFTVTSKDYRYGDFNIPLELRGLPGNLILIRASFEDHEVNNVTVRTRASEAIIRSMGERAMFLSVDISHLDEGRHMLQLSESMVLGRPPGVEITEIFPRVLELEIEPLLIQPAVRVRPEILGKPAGNFDVVEILCVPPTVRVSGPKKIVEKIETLSTPQINVDGMTATVIERSLVLVSPHPLVKLMPESVNLRIRIGEREISRNFERMPVEVRKEKYVTQINPRTLDAWVQGPHSQIEKIARKNIRVFVTLNDLEPSRKNIRLEPQLEISPSDSFPQVRLERFSQNYVDALVTNHKAQD
ncbi:MAG: CdaR family protein [Candidatus Glassbacteria bacterium]